MEFLASPIHEEQRFYDHLNSLFYGLGVAGDNFYVLGREFLV